MPKLNPKVIEQVRKLFGEAYYDEEIADRTGIRKSSGGNWKRRNRLCSRSP